MFDEFVTTKNASSGWGLFMARELMLRLYGSIAAENGSSGGAPFRLRFPRSTNHVGASGGTSADFTKRSLSCGRQVVIQQLNQRVELEWFFQNGLCPQGLSRGASRLLL